MRPEAYVGLPPKKTKSAADGTDMAAAPSRADTGPDSLSYCHRMYERRQVDRQRQVAYLDGRLSLPLAATIKLYDGATNSHGTATVVGVRLLNGTAEVPSQLCLDVTVENGWWARFDEREAREAQG